MLVSVFYYVWIPQSGEMCVIKLNTCTGHHGVYSKQNQVNTLHIYLNEVVMNALHCPKI